MKQSREIQLIRRPVGTPVAEDFNTVHVDVAEPDAGAVQVRNLWMAIDPAMRGRMSDAKSYVPPFALDAFHGLFTGANIGRTMVRLA